MKTRKHRIFIIGNFPKPQGSSTVQAQNEEKAGTPPKKREESKRRKLFKEVVVDRRESMKEKYAYQVRQHIQAESLGSLFTCDLMGNSAEQPKQQKQEQKVEQKVSKPEERVFAIEKIQVPVRQKQNPSQIALRAQATHNDTFTGGLRRRIFQSLPPQESRSQRCLSTLQVSKRRKIFSKYESPNNLSINTSLSKERCRIFSLNPKTPALPSSPIQILAPLQQTIKEQEQQNISRITYKNRANDSSRLRS